MLRHTFSPLRALFAIIAICSAVYGFLTMIPRLTVKPTPTTDPRADFGTMFNLSNNGVASVRDLNSTICVNSSTNMGSTGTTAGGAESFGDANQPLGLSDLDHGDAVALPFESLKPGPSGSKVDFVFIIRFQPGWWFWHEERRFRFSGTGTSDRTWVWKPLPLGGPCG
jgi:hypothetical protein